jgi:hypothetical protein
MKDLNRKKDRGKKLLQVAQIKKALVRLVAGGRI